MSFTLIISLLLDFNLVQTNQTPGDRLEELNGEKKLYSLTAKHCTELIN